VALRSSENMCFEIVKIFIGKSFDFIPPTHYTIFVVHMTIKYQTKEKQRGVQKWHI